jgi:hypothetical protein
MWSHMKLGRELDVCPLPKAVFLRSSTMTVGFREKSFQRTCLSCDGFEKVFWQELGLPVGRESVRSAVFNVSGAPGGSAYNLGRA